MKNLKIGTQLKLGLATMLFFVIALGIGAYIQSDQIQQQVIALYNHPLKVQRAIGGLKSDILSIHRDMKDLSLTNDSREMAVERDWIEWWKKEAAIHIDTLYNQYLGPRSDVDSVKKAFISLVFACDEINDLLRSGNNGEVYNRTKTFGIIGSKMEILLAKIQIIDTYAINKSEELYKKSQDLRSSLNNQLLAMVITNILLSLLINYLFLKSIHKPLNIMIDANQRFQNGDMNARSGYESQNEFGKLSASFNSLADTIQAKTKLSQKIADLARLMLSKYEAKEFFLGTLNALASHTGSQMAAVYLLSEDKKFFDHFESIGIDDNARQSFSATSFEGEFGPALFSQKVQHIKEITTDTRFVFYTVSGKVIPCEIITIPILTNSEVVAIISLASVHAYAEEAILLIDNIFVTLRARVEGIIAYHKMRMFSEKLELQNNELEAQKVELLSQSSEMASQSAELVKQNMELAIQKQQLAEANRLKTNFLSNMSHELRTPLNSIIALSSVLNRHLVNVIPEEEYSYLEVIGRNGKHLLSLINDILDISRIEAGHEEVEISEFKLKDLIAEVINMIRPQAKKRNLKLILNENNDEIFISSDADKCSHILQNIISNAVKFTEEGKVEVITEQIDHNVLIKVTDTGIGIPENQIKHIFDEFRQGDSSTSRRFGGTGLGLAIAKKYADFLEGGITVKSAVGKGSVFTLTLPLRYSGKIITSLSEQTDNRGFAAKPESLAAKTDHKEITILLVEDSEPAKIEKPVVLVVEDNPDNMISTKAVLSDNFSVLEAIDGNQGVEMAKKHVPDLILMDIDLPGINGIEAFTAIRNDPALQHIPIIALTASAMVSDQETILAHGFDAYIAKPIDELVFYKTINRTLYGE